MPPEDEPYAAVLAALRLARTRLDEARAAGRSTISEAERVQRLETRCKAM